MQAVLRPIAERHSSLLLRRTMPSYQRNTMLQFRARRSAATTHHHHHCDPLAMSPLSFVNTTTTRSFASQSKTKQTKKKKSQKPKELSRAALKRQRERQAEFNFRQERRKKLMRQKNLHPAAKWKRILSACNFWFSRGNLYSDTFLRDTLKQHNGWMPIETLLTFPKFHRWTDAQLLVDAFSSTAAQKKYVLTYDPADWEQSQPKGKKKKTRKRQQKQPQDQSSALKAASTSTTTLTNLDAVAKDASLSQQEAPTCDHHDNETPTESSLHGDMPEYERKLAEIEQSLLEDDSHLFTSGSHSDMDEDDVYIGDPFYHSSSDSETDSESDGWDNDDDGDADHGNAPAGTDQTDDVGEKDESPAAGSSTTVPRLLHNAAVRHRKVTLDVIEMIEQELREGYTGEDDDDASIEPGFLDTDYYQIESFLEQPTELEETTEKASKEKLKKSHLVNYKTKRSVVVIQSVEKLDRFCDSLVRSVKEFSAGHGEDPKACAIGFDVEYCTLDLDIRDTLPAMLQLSSPAETGPLGLIWLDKFPNHGRDMLSNDACKPLVSLLADPSILKVGVGVHGDAAHLASWWGITDRQYASHFFGGLVDLEELEDHESLHDKSLREMTAIVLHRNLPKLKEKKSKRQKDRKRQGRSVPTAHWRRDQLTNRMREYAAHDSASAVDIWRKIQGFDEAN